MSKAIVKDINTLTTNSSGVKTEIHSAEIHIISTTIPVQLYKGNEGKWRAIREDGTTIYEMDNVDKESINDWVDGEIVEITQPVPYNPN